MDPSLARMNKPLHGVKNKDFDIHNGDTFEDDEFEDFNVRNT